RARGGAPRAAGAATRRRSAQREEHGPDRRDEQEDGDGAGEDADPSHLEPHPPAEAFEERGPADEREKYPGHRDHQRRRRQRLVPGEEGEGGDDDQRELDESVANYGASCLNAV